MGFRSHIAIAALASLAAAAPLSAAKYKVLCYWGVGGFAHDSRPVANKYLDSLAKVMDFELTLSEAASVFTSANLAQYRVLVVNNSTAMGRVLDSAQRKAFMEFARTRGVVAWHASGDQGGSFPEWSTWLGGDFSGHGAGIATVRKDPGAAGHPLASGPDTARFDEEWYSFKTNPRAAQDVQVLYSLDEKSCNGTHCFSPLMGDHPIVWTRTSSQGGRLFYSGMGHFHHLFQKTRFTLDLYRQAMDWAAAGGTASADPASRAIGAPGWYRVGYLPSGWEVEIPAAGPHSLVLAAPDGRVSLARSGTSPARYHVPRAAAGNLQFLKLESGSGRSTLVLK